MRDFDQLIVESIATTIVSTVKKATAPLQTRIETLEAQLVEVRGALGIGAQTDDQGDIDDRDVMREIRTALTLEGK